MPSSAKLSRTAWTRGDRAQAFLLWQCVVVFENYCPAPLVAGTPLGFPPLRQQRCIGLRGGSAHGHAGGGGCPAKLCGPSLGASSHHPGHSGPAGATITWPDDFAPDYLWAFLIGPPENNPSRRLLASGEEIFAHQAGACASRGLARRSLFPRPVALPAEVQTHRALRGWRARNADEIAF